MKLLKYLRCPLTFVNLKWHIIFICLLFFNIELTEFIATEYDWLLKGLSGHCVSYLPYETRRNVKRRVVVAEEKKLLRNETLDLRLVSFCLNGFNGWGGGSDWWRGENLCLSSS